MAIEPRPLGAAAAARAERPIGRTRLAVEAPVVAPSKSTYGQILGSSALIGASSLLEICFRIVRTKAMAVLLGPAGIGLLGLYASIAELAQTFAGLGLNSSGVREIARAVGTGESDDLARTARVLRLSSVLAGALGAALLALLAGPVAGLTFGDRGLAGFVALLSLAVLLRLSAAGQQAVLQGTRRIADLARIAVWDALFGSALMIAAVYALGEAGVVPGLVAAAACNLAVCWWYGRKLALAPAPMTRALWRRELPPLLKLGLAFMASSLLTMGSAWAIRVIVLRDSGVDAAGFYQSAWTIGGLYLGFILQAMGTDFYPRLTAAAHDESECNRLVNEQTQIGILLGGPGVLTTLAFTPLVITLLYSSAFQAAVEPLRWICLGMMLRVVTWPLGFVLVARGMRLAFVAVDLAYAIVHVGLAWLLVPPYGVTGAGMAFFGSYLFHALVVYPVVRSVTGFRYSPANGRLLPAFVALIAAAFALLQAAPGPWATTAAAAVAVGSGVWSLRALVGLVPPEHAPPILRRVLALFRRSAA